MEIALNLLVIMFLLVLSAFWSGSETALTSLSKSRIRKITALNRALAAPLSQWLKSPYYLLTTILVGNTLTNLLLSSLSTVLALRLFGALPRGLVEFGTWLGLTLLLLVLGEVTPKVFSRCNAEKVTLFALPVLSRITALFRPVVWPAAKLIRLFFPKTDILPIAKLSYLSVEDIRSLISESDVDRMIGREAGQMLERVVGIGEMNVTRIMTPVEEIDSVPLGQVEERFLDRIVETGRSRVPVYNPALKKITGFIHTKDLLWAWKHNEGHFSEDLIRPPYYVPPDKKVYDLLKEFQSGKTHVAFVVSAFGELLGLVTLEDVLEEIVGEILDEYDLSELEEENGRPAGAETPAGGTGRK